MTHTVSANVDLVRSISAAWERGDYGSVEWADPAIEFVIADGPEPGSSTGHAGLAPDLLDFQSAWEEYHSEAVEYRELDDERVFVLTYAHGRGRRSGLEIAQRRANLFSVRDGRVTRLVAYWDRDRALVELGLAPETAPPALEVRDTDGDVAGERGACSQGVRALEHSRGGQR